MFIMCSYMCPCNSLAVLWRHVDCHHYYMYAAKMKIVQFKSYISSRKSLNPQGMPVISYVNRGNN